MARDEKVRRLSGMWLFSGCSQRELSLIARASQELSVTAGRVLCEQGRVGQEFFLILDGKAVVKRNGRRIGSLGRGDHFGEMALLDRLPRSASVVAESDMDLLVLSQREFNALMDRVPTLSRKLLAALSERLREADSRLVG
jgi:CRP/FNR family cyclic AMP-dependent transcriptional regulator